ncbi:MAG: nuclear transport factor 2 family protein [Chloroflexota bacterium]|nr:nuclear transport factor 2 family protein [Chloroflexota bacterium]
MQKQLERTREDELQALAMDYLEAFEARDLERCVAFYDDSATVVFHVGRYEGKEAITTWHQDRFGADLQLLSMDGTSALGDTVTIDATATSKRLKAWRIPSLAAKVEFTFDGDLITYAKFGLRV